LQNGEQIEISCALTYDGVQEFGDGESDYCIAQDPYYNVERGLQAGSQSRMVIMERHLADTTFAKLYLMDGHDIPYVEKVEEGSNDYVKMWDIE